MKIDQISTMTERGAGLIAKMVEIAPILQYAEFRSDFSTSLNVPDKSTFTGTAARAVGSGFVKDLQSPNPQTVTLKSYGREIAVDDLYKADAKMTGSPIGLQRYLDRQLASAALKIATEIQSHMFVGSGVAPQILGLSNFVKDAAAGGQTAALGFTTAEQAAMNENVSLQLNTTANQDAFLELLFKALASVPGANAIVCNINLAARLTTIAKRIGAAGENLNSFGTKVVTFNNVPIVSLPTDAIPQNESDGTNTDCTSLYVIRFAEELGVCYSTNSGFVFQDFQDFQTLPQGVSRLQINLDTIVERTDAIKRLSRIRL